MRLGRDGIAGLIGLAVSLTLLPQAMGLPKLPIVPVGPGFYPTIVLVFLAVTSGALFVQDILAQRRASADKTQTAEALPRAYGLVAAAFLIIGGYIAVLPMLGFRLATVIFVSAFQFLLEPPKSSKQWAVLALVAVGATVVTYFVFERYLLVLLPRGAWTGW